MLVLIALALIAVYVFNRQRAQAHPGRPKRRGRASAAADRQADAGATDASAPPSGAQMDMFAGQHDADFDEFGVGKPRRRRSDAGRAAAGAADDRALQGKIVTLLIAERNGTPMNAAQLSHALQTQVLHYGDRRIFHRLVNGYTVFSVAGLIRPGYLEPQDPGFSTPGLSIFMQLPGPVAAQEALADMIATARALAHQLNADVYDAHQQLLIPELEQALYQDVHDWAVRNPF